MSSEDISAGRFEEHLLEEGYAASTAASYARSVRKLLEWTRAEGLGPEELAYVDLVAWARSLSYAPKTVNGSLTAVRHWMAWLKDRGLREDNPARGLKVRGERTRALGNVLSEEELSALYRNHPGRNPSASRTERRDRVITGLVAFQALRRGELEALRPEDLDLEAATVDVPEKGRGEKRTLKLRPEQIAPLMRYLEDVRPQLIEASLEAGGDEPEVLLMSAGRSRHLTNVLREWIVQLMGQHPKVESARQMRASRIVLWIRSEGLRRAQKKAGHAYVSSTERYREADLEGLKASIEQHHPLK